jgi:Calx-beta domain
VARNGRAFAQGAPARLVVAFAILLALTLALVGRDAGADNGPVHVNLSDVQVNESDGTATLTATLDGAPAGDFTLDFSTADGSATAPGDYRAKSGTLQFHAGDSSAQTFNVRIVDNGDAQPDHSFTVALGNPSDDTLGQPGAHGTATVTIVDSDWQVTAPAPDHAAVPESGGTIDFSVALNGTAQHHPITVDYAVTDDSAKRGSDYKMTNPTAASGTFTFAPDETTKHIKVTGIDDNQYGSDKKFNVTLSNPGGATLASGADQPVSGTISEADAPPTIGISNCLGSPIAAGGDAQFLVRSSPSQLPVTMHYTTVDDSTLPDDFDHVTNGDLTIPAGSTQASFSVHTHANPPSGDRSFHVDLTDLTNANFLTSSSSHASCTIRQAASGGGGGGSSSGSVSIADPAPIVQPTGGAPVSDTFTVSYHPPTSLPPNPPPVTVTWTTQDGTATSPADYSGGSGTLTWAAGETGDKTFVVKVNPTSTTSSVAKHFTVTITAQNATVSGSGTATAQILPPGTTASQLSIGDTTGSESAGSIPVVVTLAPAATAPVTVGYASSDGTATAGSDYTAVGGTLTFAPGETKKTINIAVTNDSTPERDETLFVTLANASGATIFKAQATVTILDDDPLPAAIPRVSPFTKSVPTPVPLPQQQPTQPTTKHLVLPALVNGESRVDAKGRASFRVSCPGIAVGHCRGTVAMDVRVPQKKNSKKLKLVRVANGKFSVPAGYQRAVTIQLTKPGLAVLKTYKRIRVKATLKATDESGAKGVTAWIVSLAMPKATPKKATK